jgi:hypothetical protein
MSCPVRPAEEIVGGLQALLAARARYVLISGPRSDRPGSASPPR